MKTVSYCAKDYIYEIKTIDEFERIKKLEGEMQQNIICAYMIILGIIGAFFVFGIQCIRRK